MVNRGLRILSMDGGGMKVYLFRLYDELLLESLHSRDDSPAIATGRGFFTVSTISYILCLEVMGGMYHCYV